MWMPPWKAVQTASALMQAETSMRYKLPRVSQTVQGGLANSGSMLWKQRGGGGGVVRTVGQV